MPNVASVDDVALARVDFDCINAAKAAPTFNLLEFLPAHTLRGEVPTDDGKAGSLRGAKQRRAEVFRFPELIGYFPKRGGLDSEDFLHYANAAMPAAPKVDSPPIIEFWEPSCAL